MSRKALYAAALMLAGANIAIAAGVFPARAEQPPPEPTGICGCADGSGPEPQPPYYPICLQGWPDNCATEEQCPSC